jgi:hypothetical protein
MLVNKDTGVSSFSSEPDEHADFTLAVSTSNILLVPYEDHHVPTYHSWMKEEVFHPFMYS